MNVFLAGTRNPLGLPPRRSSAGHKGAPRPRLGERFPLPFPPLVFSSGGGGCPPLLMTTDAQT